MWIIFVDESLYNYDIVAVFFDFLREIAEYGCISADSKQMHFTASQPFEGTVTASVSRRRPPAESSSSPKWRKSSSQEGESK